MAEINQSNRPRKRKTVRVILLVITLLTSPLCCLGGAQVMALLPLPEFFSLFAEETIVQNGTAEMITLTPITTTRGYPQVIYQTASLRQCQVPAAPGEAVTLTYDAADFPLAGVVVCQEAGTCRLLEYTYGDDMVIASYQSLPELDADWQEAAQACRLFNLGLVVFPLLSLVPLGAFVGWFLIRRREDKKAV